MVHFVTTMLYAFAMTYISSALMIFLCVRLAPNPVILPCHPLTLFSAVLCLLAPGASRHFFGGLSLPAVATVFFLTTTYRLQPTKDTHRQLITLSHVVDVRDPVHQDELTRRRRASRSKLLEVRILLVHDKDLTTVAAQTEQRRRKVESDDGATLFSASRRVSEAQVCMPNGLLFQHGHAVGDVPGRRLDQVVRIDGHLRHNIRVEECKERLHPACDIERLRCSQPKLRRPWQRLEDKNHRVRQYEVVVMADAPEDHLPLMRTERPVHLRLVVRVQERVRAWLDWRARVVCGRPQKVPELLRARVTLPFRLEFLRQTLGEFRTMVYLEELSIPEEPLSLDLLAHEDRGEVVHVEH